jgi:hypothetical protein
VTYLREKEVLDFTFFLTSFAMRHVRFQSLGKSDLLDEALSLMAMVAKSSFLIQNSHHLSSILDQHELDHKTSS